jgi:DNA-binding NarL/FixJ family response regulator
MPTAGLLPAVSSEMVLERATAQEGSVATLTTLHLSAREAEVLRLVADGFDTTDIADQLAYSESTIKGVLAKIMGRLNARNRCHAIAIVVREGLI